MHITTKLLITLCVLRYVQCSVSFGCDYEDMPKVMVTGIGYIMGDVRLSANEPLEIYCSGDSMDLILKKREEILPSVTVNSTTIKFFQEKSRVQDIFFCENTKKRCKVTIRVVADYVPELKDFKCVSKNLEVLNCSWTSSNYLVGNFKLSYEVNEIYSNQCRRQYNYRTDSYFCLWYSRTASVSRHSPIYIQELNFYSFSMQACNYFGCLNQKYIIDHFSIVKLNPPESLKVLNINTRSVVLEWTISRLSLDVLPNGVEHEIEYWYYGNPFQPVNVSLPPNNSTFRLDLSMPCANEHYEVRIYVRPKLSSQAGIWSDHAAVHFTTDADIDGSTTMSSACGIVQKTPEIMVYFVRKFRQNANIERTERKEELRLLKQKSARITKLRNLI